MSVVGIDFGCQNTVIAVARNRGLFAPQSTILPFTQAMLTTS